MLKHSSLPTSTRSNPQNITTVLAIPDLIFFFSQTDGRKTTVRMHLIQQSNKEIKANLNASLFEEYKKKQTE